MKHFLNIGIIGIGLLIFSLIVFWVITGYLPSYHPEESWTRWFAGLYISVFLIFSYAYGLSKTNQNELD